MFLHNRGDIGITNENVKARVLRSQGYKDKLIIAKNLQNTSKSCSIYSRLSTILHLNQPQVCYGNV